MAPPIVRHIRPRASPCYAHGTCAARKRPCSCCGYATTTLGYKSKTVQLQGELISSIISEFETLSRLLLASLTYTLPVQRVISLNNWWWIHQHTSPASSFPDCDIHVHFLIGVCLLIYQRIRRFPRPTTSYCNTSTLYGYYISISLWFPTSL